MKRNRQTIQTAEEFAAEMRELGGGLPIDAAREVLQDSIIPLTAAQIQDNYDNGTDGNGNPWPPHAKATIERYGAHQLLILSGAMLRASIDGAGHIERVEVIDGGAELTFGLTTEVIVYAGVQNEGYGNIPPRPFMNYGDATLDRGNEMIADALVEALA